MPNNIQKGMNPLWKPYQCRTLLQIQYRSFQYVFLIMMIMMIIQPSFGYHIHKSCRSSSLSITTTTTTTTTTSSTHSFLSFSLSQQQQQQQQRTNIRLFSSSTPLQHDFEQVPNHPFNDTLKEQVNHLTTIIVSSSSSSNPSSKQLPQQQQQQKQYQSSSSSSFFSNPSSFTNKKTPEQVEEQLKQALASLSKFNQMTNSTTTTTTIPSWISFPSVRDCNTAIAAFGDDGDLLRALQMLGKMRKAAALPQVVLQSTKTTTTKTTTTNTTKISIPIPTLVTYSTLMSRAVKLNKPMVALRLWDLMMIPSSPNCPTSLTIPLHDIDVKAANIRMNCFAKLGDVSRAQNLLEQMIHGNGPDVPCLPPNIVTYNTLLHACQKAGDLDAALDVVRHMHHCRPDARTYTSLIATVARNKSQSAGRNDPSLAFALLEEMKSRHIRPNGITYSALIDACGRCKRPDLALQGLRSMLLQKAQESESSSSKYKDPSKHRIIYTLTDEVGAWTAAINACGKAGRIQTALRLFRAMPGFGVMPNTITCGSLTDSLLRTGATAETLDVLRYMKKNGIVPSEVMYTSLITRAESLAKMEQNGKHTFSTVSPQSHVAPLDSPSSSSSSSEEQQQQHIHDAKAIDVYTELIKSLVEGGGSSGSSRSTSGRRTATTTKDSKSGDDVLIKVFLVFQEMKSVGTVPDLACYNALLRACARAGDLDHAQDVLRQMLAADLCPNDTSWRQLLQAAAQQKSSQRALQAWKQGIEYNMERRRKKMVVDEPTLPGWKPSAASLAALITAFLAEATDSTTTKNEKLVLYRSIMELYDKVLLGDEKMGFDRMNLDEVLDNQRVIVLFIRGILALSDLEDDPVSIDTMRVTMRSILQLECVGNTDDKQRLSWAVRETLDKATAFCAS